MELLRNRKISKWEILLPHTCNIIKHPKIAKFGSEMLEDVKNVNVKVCKPQMIDEKGAHFPHVLQIYIKIHMYSIIFFIFYNIS